MTVMIGNGFSLTTDHEQCNGAPLLIGPDGETLRAQDMMPYSYLHDDLADIFGDRPAQLAASFVKNSAIGGCAALKEMSEDFCSQVVIVSLGY